MRHLPAGLLAITLPLSVATTQRMPDPRDDRRIVELHDVSGWLTQAAPNDEAGRHGRGERDQALQAVARFARAFCEPALTDEEDVSILAGRYLVAALRPEQQAWVRALIEQYADGFAPQLDVRVKQLELGTDAFDAALAPLLPGHDRAAEHAVTALDRDQLAKVVRAIARLGERGGGAELAASVRPLTAKAEKVGRTIPYVRDYDVEIETASFTATPIHDVVFEGLAVDVIAGQLDAGGIGVSLRATVSDVVEPIATFESNLVVDGKKATIELPERTTRSGEWSLRIAPGGAALCTHRSPDAVLIFLVRARPSAK